ncbi:hypothetical protein [Nocardioides conyzicola]|uniref:Uncharacterized protein n=1 Tax=Nocardioides conyzicola TaxID=1651781 RepID=A0ABP8WI41_9ACTN
MRIRNLVGAVIATLVVSMTPGGSAAAAAPEPVQVRPDDLATGALPEVAYVDTDHNLVRPGRSTVDYARPMSQPLRVHGGYVVDLARRDHGFLVEDIYFLPDTGERRLLWRNNMSTQAGQRRYLVAQLASANGRLLLLDSGTGFTLVMRVSDGRTVASRKATDGRALTGRALAFRGHRVLLASGPHARDSGPDDRFAGYLTRWDLDSNKISQVLPKARAKASGFDAVAALDLSAGQAVLATGQRQLVRPLPGESGPRWRTGHNEVVESWSPDDRYVLSIVAKPYFDISDHDLPAFATVRIRKARTGALVAEYRGLLAVKFFGPQSPAWEPDSASVLMSAFSGIDDHIEENPYGTGHGYVRCTVTKPSCELVLPRYEGAKLPSELVYPFAGPRAR